MNGRRTGNKPWKHIYGVDRKYTARVDRVKERAEYPSIGAMTPTEFEAYAERSGITAMLVETLSKETK